MEWSFTGFSSTDSPLKEKRVFSNNINKELGGFFLYCLGLRAHGPPKRLYKSVHYRLITSKINKNSTEYVIMFSSR